MKQIHPLKPIARKYIPDLKGIERFAKAFDPHALTKPRYSERNRGVLVGRSYGDDGYAIPTFYVQFVRAAANAGRTITDHDKLRDRLDKVETLASKVGCKILLVRD